MRRSVGRMPGYSKHRPFYPPLHPSQEGINAFGGKCRKNGKIRQAYALLPTPSPLPRGDFGGWRPETGE